MSKDQYHQMPYNNYKYPSEDCAPKCPPSKKPSAHCNIRSVSPYAVITELLGTLWVTLVIGAAASMFTFPAGAEGGVVAVALAAALAYAAPVKGLGWSSGGHFNPPLTLAALIVGRLTFLQALFYWIAQFAGAFAGAGLLHLFVKAFDATLGTPVPAGGFSAGRAFAAEFVVYIFLTLLLLTSARHGIFRGGVYAAVIGAASLFLVPLTGASLNPARQLGSAVVANVWTSAWVYYVASFGGAVVAALLYLFYAGAVQAKESWKKTRMIEWIRAANRA